MQGMEKSPDAFRTISEVADWLGVPTHVLRFWESRFTQVKPVKRAGGRRYYRPADMELLGGIKRLLHDDGMTIRGVQKLLREKGVRHVQGLSQPLFSDVEDAELVEGDVGAADADDRVVAFERPVTQPVAPETGDDEDQDDRVSEAADTATDAGTEETATEPTPDEVAEAAPEAVVEEEPQPVPVAPPAPEPEEPAPEDSAPDDSAPEDSDAETASEEAASDEAEAAEAASAPEQMAAPADEDRSDRASGDLFDRLPADDRAATAGPPARTFDDLPTDEDEIDDDLIEPALSTASRLLILGDEGLAAHGGVVADAHARLAALRARIDGRE